MATGGGVREYGIRLRVGAEGLENADKLGRSLRELGVDTAKLDKEAAELSSRLEQLGREQRLIDTFVRTKTATEAAAKALGEAQKEAQALGRELAQQEAPTKAQAAAMDRARTAVLGAKTALAEQRVELQQQRAALAQAGISTDDLASAQVRVRQQTDATKTAVSDLAQRYQATATAAANSSAVQQKAIQATGTSVESLGNQLRTIQALAGAAIGGQLFGGVAGQVSQTADEFKNLQARIKLVTGEGPAFDAAFEGILKIATRTNTSLEATGDLFARIAQQGREVGRSQADSLALTETINQAIQLGGGGAAAADAAVRQLIQGLQSGVVRGDEFNSIMEQSPRLAKAMADGLGVTTGELRGLAEAGALTAKTVIESLQGQAAAIEREFDQLPATVGRAIQNLSTAWTVYVGEADQASGASAKVASAVDFVARNLSELVTVLTTAGQAWLAYKALDLAATFVAQAREIRGSIAAQAAEAAVRRDSTLVVAAQTAALNVNTVAQAANTRVAAALTAAQVAGAAAQGAAAASTAAGATAVAASTATLGQKVAMVGRFAGALGLAATAVVAFGDLAVSAYKAVQKTLGETAAKLLGYKDRSEELIKQQELESEVFANATRVKAEYSQQLQRASDAAFGLSNEARKLVGDFDEARKKGDSAADALDKLSKSLQLGDLEGIKAAGAALDELARRGEISAAAVRKAFAGALDGADLLIFETTAKAAFDGSEQGARRLAAAIDAIADESLRRAGTSAQELQGGFSVAMNRAINDTDALAKTLNRLGVTGQAAGRLLAESINKEIEAAKTEKALELVRQRLVALGNEGKLAGDDVVEGLDKIDQKAGSIRPGINNVQEALNELGIKSSAELKAVADRSKAAFDLAFNSGVTGAQELAKGFVKMSADAIAANNGIEPSWLRQRQLMVESRLAAQGLGTEIKNAMGGAKQATDEASGALSAYQRLLLATRGLGGGVSGDGIAGIGPSQDGVNFGVRSPGGAANRVNTPESFDEFRSGSSAGRNPADTRTAGAGQAVNRPTSGEWTYTVNPYEVEVKGVDARGNPVAGGWMRVRGNTAGIGGAGSFGPIGGAPAPGPAPAGGAQPQDADQQMLVNQLAKQRLEIERERARLALPGSPVPSPAPPASIYTVNVTIGDKQFGIGATSQDAADQLIAALEAAHAAKGG